MRSLSTVLICLFLFWAMPAAGDKVDDELMVKLAWDSGCFKCHDLRKTLRGPAWLDVAQRYRGDDAAFERLVVKVREGGSGNWGTVSMSPNRRVPMEDIHTLVAWLLTLEE